MVAVDALVSHQLPSAGRLSGAVSILVLLACFVAGPASPLACLALFAAGYRMTAATIFAALAASFFLAGYSTAWCRFYLRGCGWFQRGVFLHVSREAIESMATKPAMWCMHPHGTFIGFGFTFNGAIRFRCRDEAKYVPGELAANVNWARLRQCDGVQAPILFKLPIVRNALLGFGCATPATKKGLFGLMRRQVDFGILPGGMEEVALFERGKERVFIKKRAGFVKYALQNGYVLQPAYTFGEADCYTALKHPLYRKLCLFTLLHGGFVLPVFWGPLWWAPLLPDPLVQINTVVAEPIALPLIAEPTAADVAKWHGVYMDTLVRIFEAHKGRFGCADRTLELL